MYYPYLRGRQNELLALKELLEKALLSRQIVPIIEPVKLSPTFVNLIKLLNDRDWNYILINNPKAGSFSTDIKNPKNDRYKEDFQKELLNGKKLIRGLIADEKIQTNLSYLADLHISEDSVVILCMNPDYVSLIENTHCLKYIIPFAPAFRRIQGSKILIEDCFKKRNRNRDYKETEDEFFSDIHLCYSNYGFDGYSDYSIIGQEYNDSGFAPHAVALHIVYFDDGNILRIHHFVSDDDDDIRNPAGKFYQALEGLIEWKKEKELSTFAMKEFERIYEAQSYPGLGFLKKLSIMHHLELVSRFLEGQI